MEIRKQLKTPDKVAKLYLNLETKMYDIVNIGEEKNGLGLFIIKDTHENIVRYLNGLTDKFRIDLLCLDNSDAVSLINYVESENLIAKSKNIYWNSVWQNAKRAINQFGIVGFNAKDEKYKTPFAYDGFHEYLKNVAANCR